ncbi:MAG: hypothetical protein QXI12_03585 [Candidatus Methanomethyliaceae archaeon]
MHREVAVAEKLDRGRCRADGHSRCCGGDDGAAGDGGGGEQRRGAGAPGRVGGNRYGAGRTELSRGGEALTG